MMNIHSFIHLSEETFDQSDSLVHVRQYRLVKIIISAEQLPFRRHGLGDMDLYIIYTYIC